MKATGLFFASSDYYTHQKIKHYTFHAVFFHFTDKKDIYLRKISCKGRATRDKSLRKVLRSALSKERATRLEGSFGTQK